MVLGSLRIAMRSEASALTRPAFAKTLAKAKTGFARANNGRRRSSGRSAQFCSELARHAEQSHKLLYN